jgi:SAM-dependent methyltransferase
VTTVLEPVEAPPTVADVLVLGSGLSPRANALNVDINAGCRPDVVHDLRVFPWPFSSESFREVWCHDILEHLPDTVATMEEIHRVSRPGARIFVTTPHFSCANAFTDPTHCHQFGMFSFDFFTGSAVHPYYTDKRFTYVKRLLVFHPSHINALIRRVANRWPAFYERHLCWIQPAFFMSIELAVRK